MDNLGKGLAGSILLVVLGVFLFGGYSFGLIITVIPHIFSTDKSYWTDPSCQVLGHNMCQSADHVITALVFAVILVAGFYMLSSLARKISENHPNIMFTIMYSIIGVFLITRVWGVTLLAVIIIGLFVLGLIAGNILSANV